MNVLPSEKPKISGLNSTICKCMEITVTSQNEATKDKHGAQLGKITLFTEFRFHEFLQKLREINFAVIQIHFKKNFAIV